MRRILIASAVLVLAACNNDSGSTVKSGQKTLADSLEMDVDKGHSQGMAKMGKLTRYQQYTRSLRDSINALPAASRAQLDAMLKQLDTLQNQIDSADLEMNKWMEAYRYDSLKDNAELRATYLSGEKIKVEALVGLILSAISRGDSLLPISKPAGR